MTIHVVVGPPCSGKSTFVQTNAPAGTPRWDFDHVASTVAGAETSHDIPQPVRELVLAMRRGLMGYVLDAETEVEELWIIHASPSPNMIQRLAAIGAEFHLLDPGIEECLARAQRENRPDFTEDAIRAWYDNPPEIPGEKGEPTVKTKAIRVQVKAGEDDELPAGQITAYASVFDTVDSYGDVVRKGAFTDTLAEWKDSGNTLPLLYGHDMRDPFSNIGGVTTASEDDHGLKITADFDLDNPTAAQVYKLVKEKRLSQMSFAFSILEASWAEQDGQEVYELRKLKLHEVSVVPIGANPDTEILDVKKPAEDLARALVNALERAAPGSRQKAEPDKPPAATDDHTTSEDDPSEVSHSQGQKKSLTARLMLLERTHNHV